MGSVKTEREFVLDHGHLGLDQQHHSLDECLAPDNKFR